MTNLEIKKEILRVTKRLKNVEIRVVLWHGDSMEIEGDAIYNEVLIFSDNELLSLEHPLYFNKTLRENNTNLITLKKAQQHTCIYLEKYFFNVVKEECNV